ncbi:hypothetical protein [Vibrio mediterranei]|uniref:hypothetical protein n=1 Tax=Vibrio mediterranei TaxID=689 RepID=UPI00148CA916|nr:hypothetical protein [Vibrio mediterranei]NOI26782.1 hypothetical protein [Vibrio mediterranei]
MLLTKNVGTYFVLQLSSFGWPNHFNGPTQNADFSTKVLGVPSHINQTATTNKDAYLKLGSIPVSDFSGKKLVISAMLTDGIGPSPNGQIPIFPDLTGTGNNMNMLAVEMMSLLHGYTSTSATTVQLVVSDNEITAFHKIPHKHGVELAAHLLGSADAASLTQIFNPTPSDSKLRHFINNSGTLRLDNGSYYQAGASVPFPTTSANHTQLYAQNDWFLPTPQHPNLHHAVYISDLCCPFDAVEDNVAEDTTQPPTGVWLSFVVSGSDLEVWINSQVAHGQNTRATSLKLTSVTVES